MDKSAVKISRKLGTSPPAHDLKWRDCSGAVSVLFDRLSSCLDRGDPFAVAS